MKYDAQLASVKNQLDQSKSILIALSAEPTLDELGAGLALFLALHQASKDVAIVSDGMIKVSQTSLYGVDQVANTLPKTVGGDLTLTLEGVVAADGTVPALEKLDWFPEGTNLNLVFHVLPNQRFEPSRILPSYKGGGFNLVFCIGASSLTALGSIYANNQAAFSGVPIVNIDNDSASGQFGGINITDQTPTISEMVVQIIPGLGLTLDQDIASNLLTGIYDTTRNLSQNVGPETFIAVGLAMQAGGKNPQLAAPGPVTSTEVSSEQPAPPASTPVVDNGFMPLNQVFGFPASPDASQGGPAQPQPVSVVQIPSSDQPSPEDRPNNEQAGGSSPEVSNPDPNWLTPKIFKGGSVG